MTAMASLLMFQVYVVGMPTLGAVWYNVLPRFLVLSSISFLLCMVIVFTMFLPRIFKWRFTALNVFSKPSSSNNAEIPHTNSGSRTFNNATSNDRIDAGAEGNPQDSGASNTAVFRNDHEIIKEIRRRRRSNVIKAVTTTTTTQQPHETGEEEAHTNQPDNLLVLDGVGITTTQPLLFDLPSITPVTDGAGISTHSLLFDMPSIAPPAGLMMSGIRSSIPDLTSNHNSFPFMYSDSQSDDIVRGLNRIISENAAAFGESGDAVTSSRENHT